MRYSRYLTAVALAALTATACKGKDEANTAQVDTTAATAPAGPALTAPTVRSVRLGKSIGTDKRVATAATTFASRDTIYASVETDGQAPEATLSARWTFQDGQVVDSSSQQVSLSGPATHEFHISKRTAWPAGRYRVEISLNGQPVDTAEFDVKR